MMCTSNNAANERIQFLNIPQSPTHTRAGGARARALGVYGFLQSAPTSVRAQIRLNAWLEAAAGFRATRCSESRLKATGRAAATRALRTDVQ